VAQAVEASLHRERVGVVLPAAQKYPAAQLPLQLEEVNDPLEPYLPAGQV